MSIYLPIDCPGHKLSWSILNAKCQQKLPLIRGRHFSNPTVNSGSNSENHNKINCILVNC